jgi:Peptidase family M28
MEANATVWGLEQFAGRGAGTDAERRAANWLAEQLSSAAREPLVETFWCRPNWAVTQLWHVTLAIAGSLVALASPIAGIMLLALALLSVISDEVTGSSLGRRLTPERASQNVVAGPTRDHPDDAARVRLILTANYDAGRVGVAYRAPLRTAAARLRHAVRGVTPGWLGWLAIMIIWLLAVAVLRLLGHKSQTIGAIQLPPTVALVLGFALLLELATGEWSPSAGDNGTGVAAVLALADALAAAPPQHLSVEVVLTGAGDRDQIGLRRYLRSRRRRRRPTNTAVLGFAACGAASIRWWHSDGALVPLRYARQLRQLSSRVATEEPHLTAGAHRGRGSAPALRARIARLPAISLGCLDAHGLAPRSHQRADVAAAVDRGSLEHAIQFALLLVDQIDAAVGDQRARRSATPA